MPQFIGINCWYEKFHKLPFSKYLSQKDEQISPVSLHQLLIQQMNDAFSILKKNKSSEKLKKCNPAIQINSEDPYLTDPNNLAFYPHLKPLYSAAQIHMNLHGGNFVFPLREDPKFITSLNWQLKLAKVWQTQNITIHLPMRPEDDTANIVDTLTDSTTMDIIQNYMAWNSDGKPSVTLDLENKHHNAFFDDLYHLTALMEALDDRLQAMGNKKLGRVYNICFDFGHYVIQAREKGYSTRKMLEDFFHAQKSRIHTLHLHVNDGSYDQHLMAGEPDLPQTQYLATAPYSINLDRVYEHQRILMDLLPILNLERQSDWTIIMETEFPFTPEAIAQSIRWLSELF
jgi:sugar phosphate isomerase/epimerase